MAVGVAIAVASELFKFGLGRSARRKRRRARVKLARITQVKNLQARRQFLQNFARAQAEQLLAGQREGGLESSLFQGQEAALRTRGEVFLKENREVAQLGGQAQRAIASAERLQGFADLAGAASSIAQII